MKTIAPRIGNPDNPPLGKIEGIPEGVPFAVELSARDYDGNPLDVTGQDFIVTLAKSARDKKPVQEWHLWDRQVTIVDEADARFRVEFSSADSLTMEAGNRTLHYWTEPRDGSDGRMLQARDEVDLDPAVEPDYSPPPRLVTVGFPDVIGGVEPTPYEVDPQTGFGGGLHPIGYVSTIAGVTEPIIGTLTLDRSYPQHHEITITAMDGRGDVMTSTFQQVTTAGEPVATTLATAASISPESPTEGNTVTLTPPVFNGNPTPAVTFDSATVDGVAVTVMDNMIGEIPAGTLSVQWTASNTAGTLQHTLTATVAAAIVSEEINSLWTGAVDQSSVTATVRTADSTSPVRLVASTSPDFSSPIYSDPVTPDASHYFARAKINGLAAGTEYHLAAEVGGERVTNLVGKCRTAPASGAFSFALASCAATGSDALIFDTIAAQSPAFFMHMGDLHYVDIATNEPALFHDAYDAVFAAPRQRDLWANLPMFYTWDDHDYGPNNSDASSASRAAAVASYRARVPSPALALSGATDAVYYSFDYGRMRFAVLDLRSERTASEMMSATQEAWLIGLMENLPDGMGLGIVSTVPWVATTGTDTWADASAQRTRVADAVTANIPGRAIIMGGDAHMLAYDDGSNSVGGIPVIQAAPLDRTSSTKGGPYTSGPTPAEAGVEVSQYGWMDVAEIADGLSVRFRGYRVDRATGAQTVQIDQTLTLTASVTEPEVIPVAITSEGAFDPAAPTEGQPISLVEPTYIGTEPITRALALTLDGLAIAEADLASGVSAGALQAVWTFTGPNNSVTSTATATVSAAAAVKPARMGAPTATSTASEELTITLPATDPDPGSEPITSYVYQWSSNGGTIWDGQESTERSITVSVPAGDYIAQAAAKSTVGVGQFSMNSNTVTVAAVVATPNAPTTISLSANTITEDAMPGSTVGVLSSDGEGVTFALASDPSGFFAVSGTSLLIADGADPVPGSYTVEVLAENDGGGITRTFTITVERAFGTLEQKTATSSVNEAEHPSTVNFSAPKPGNLLVATGWFDKDAGAVSVPPGWTVVGYGNTAGVSGGMAYKVSDGTETSFTVTSTNPQNFTLAVTEYAGPFDPALTVEVYKPELAGTSTSSITLTAPGASAGNFAVAMYVNDSMARQSATPSIDNGFNLDIVPLDLLSPIGTYMDGAPGLIVGSKVLRAAGDVSVTIGHDEVADESQAILAVFKRGSGVVEEPVGGAVLTAASADDGSYRTTLSNDDPSFVAPPTGVTLTANRTSVVAGEGVYLKINGLSEDQMALYHFDWNLDISGEFQFIPNLPWHMRQKGRASGHHQVAAWGVGNANPTVQVFPPLWSEQSPFVLTLSNGPVVNQNPDDVFAGKTWAIDPSGTGAIPAGATRVANYPAARNALVNANGGRILWPRGKTLTHGGSGDKPAVTGGIMFDAWGDPSLPLPIIDVSGDELVNKSGFKWTGSTKPAFVLIKNLSHVGAVTMTGHNATSTPAPAWNLNTPSRYTFNGCNFEKMGTAITQEYAAAKFDVTVFDCRITEWESYGIYLGDSGIVKPATRNIMVRGTALFQGRDAISGPDIALPPRNGPIRVMDLDDSNIIFSQMDMFSASGWSADGLTREGPERPYAIQQLMRFGANTAENVNALINEVWGEGEFNLGAGGTSKSINGAGFISCFGNYLLAISGYSGGGIALGHTGAWCRDNIIVFPDVNQLVTNVATIFNFGNGGSASWGTKPYRVFNNTIAWMLSVGNHGSMSNPAPPSYDAIMKIPSATNTEAANNVLWTPNITLAGESAPRVPDGIHSAGTWGMTPRWRGKRNWRSDGVTVHTDPTSANPPDAAILPLLSDTSKLKGTASTTLCGAADFLGRRRTAAPTPGAVEIETV